METDYRLFAWDFSYFSAKARAYFRFKEFQALEAATIISRTGYTGEWGYEIYLPNEAVADLWNKIITHDKCEPAGLGARDTLRLEMGYPLYGHELSEQRTPMATSRGMFINMDKDFIGKEHVANPEALLVGLRFESKRAAREHDKVFLGDNEVGEVTSGSLAPSLDVAVAMAFVKPDLADIGRVLEVEIRGKRFPAKIVDLPFYKSGTARG